MGTIDLAAGNNSKTGNGPVKPPDPASLSARPFAFDPVEIEEWTDLYFFRPLGAVVARGAAALRTTPAQVTIFGGFVGIWGGSFLFDVRFGLVGFALLIMHGIIDSADGQLARMTERVTELGRVLDGVSGYVTHGAIYFAIALGIRHRGGSNSVLFWMALAVLANVAQAQMYEYHRYLYKTVVAKGRAPRNDPVQITSPWLRSLYRGYLRMQHLLGGLHPEVETLLITRATAGVVHENDRARYRECFRAPVRGWNLLGDNPRFYAIGILAFLHRIDLFFVFILVPMSLALIALWLWQRRADRRFLDSV
jgi:phosphatidylglycerophosphate synthase